MEANHSLGLNQSFNSEGHDIFFDFDRDGDQDLLILDQRVPTLYKNTNNHYYRDEAFFQEVTCVYSIAIGDLNGDGYLDLYFGTELVFIKSDNISFNDREIHYVVHNHSADKSDRINFNTPAQSIDIDFIWHNPGNTNDDPLNIFIGEKTSEAP